MSIPATGARALCGLARENFGWCRGGDEPLGYHRVVLPLALGLVHGSLPGGLTLASQTSPGDLPGAITGAADVTVRCTTRDLLQFLEHLMGHVAKTTVTPGVYQYVFTWRPDEAISSFWGFAGLPPVESWYLYGVKFAKLDLNFAAGQVINAKLTGQVGHGTRAERSDQTAGTGTYVLGPWLRGPIADPTAGGIWVKVISPSDGTTDTTFKVLQKATAPDAGEWTAAPTKTVLLGLSGEGEWQDTGFGVYSGADKNLLEVLFPGAKADHSDLVANDVFFFATAIEEPVPTYVSGLNTAFSIAHVEVSRRDVGGATWEAFQGNSSTLSIDSPLTARTGFSTRYVTGMDRLSPFNPTTQVVREYTDDWFERRFQTKTPIELRQEIVGPLIGATTHRHRIRLDWASAEITGQTRPVGNPGLVSETIQFAGRSDDEGSDPLTVTVVTDHNFTLFGDL